MSNLDIGETPSAWPAAACPCRGMATGLPFRVLLVPCAAAAIRCSKSAISRMFSRNHGSTLLFSETSSTLMRAFLLRPDAQSVAALIAVPPNISAFPLAPSTRPRSAARIQKMRSGFGLRKCHSSLVVNVVPPSGRNCACRRRRVPARPISRPRRPFCRASLKVRPMAMVSPTDFICVPRRSFGTGELLKTRTWAL